MWTTLARGSCQKVLIVALAMVHNGEQVKGRGTDCLRRVGNFKLKNIWDYLCVQSVSALKILH
jgi:hypothetical protein